jgi:hypothetical protein
MEIPDSPGVDVRNLATVFADVTNSYKFYWLLSILDSLREHNQPRMSMQDLSLRMLAKVWYPLDFFKLSFGKQDSFKTVAAAVSSAITVDNRPAAPSLYEQLRTGTSPAALESLLQATRRLLAWVPYRFIRPFFAAETRSIPDQQVNARVTRLAASSTHAPYRIEGDHIVLHEAWVRYFQEHQLILRAFAQWHMVQFLQKHNPNVIGLSQKLEKLGPEQRKLNAAKRYWQGYLDVHPSFACIYSGQNITSLNMSLDHFLPWSFVVHDQLWNIIPTPKAVNSAKNDWLPDLAYFPAFARQQYQAFHYHANLASQQVLLEDYHVLFGQSLQEVRECSFEAFENRLRAQVIPQWQTAHNLGFRAPFRFVVPQSTRN